MTLSAEHNINVADILAIAEINRDEAIQYQCAKDIEGVHYYVGGVQFSEFDGARENS